MPGDSSAGPARSLASASALDWNDHVESKCLAGNRAGRTLEALQPLFPGSSPLLE